MVKRANEYKSQDKPYMFLHDSIDLNAVPQLLKEAVLYYEDKDFYKHRGYSLRRMKDALKIYENRRPSENFNGFSTISQQTAKNVFLYPNRTILRKILELYFTILIEFIWGKDRIFEVYLNSIEWGRGIYGFKSAVSFYYQIDPSALNLKQTSGLASVLINPRKLTPLSKEDYFRFRRSFFMKKMSPPTYEIGGNKTI
jgi:monofunctional biosynthetic peptidoglycan transglycosylase